MAIEYGPTISDLTGFAWQAGLQEIGDKSQGYYVRGHEIDPFVQCSLCVQWEIIPTSARIHGNLAIQQPYIESMRY